MFSDSMIIFRKELKRIFTDRRTLIFLVLLPLIMLPAMYSVMAKMDQAKQQDIAAYTSSIAFYEGRGNGDTAERFMEKLSAMNTLITPVDEDDIPRIRQSITEKETELLIVLPDSLQARMDDYETFDVGVYFNSASDYSQFAMGSVRGILQELNDEMVRWRVISRGIPEEVLSVFTVNDGDIIFDLAAEGSAMAKFIGLLLPFFIIIYLFVNSMKVGLDSVAGEKERGTLAVLLVNQVSRLSIVIGKMLSVMVAAIVGAASSILGLIIGSRYFASMFGETGGLSGYSMGGTGLVQFAVLIIPLAILVASMVIVISTYARNSKEGQGMIMPLYFAVMILGMATMQSGENAPAWMSRTPVVNSLLAMKSVFMHDAGWSSVLFASLSSCILAAILIYLTLRMFSSEKILFRI